MGWRKGGSVVLSGEVRRALEAGKAVVALESTIIAHGMPYPQNLATAQRLEEIVRLNGAVPATVAVLAGVLKVGLNQNELEQLAKGGKDIVKVSRRDMTAVMAKGGNGATTVSGTIMACDLAGIRVFATGGIGGVHRGAESSFDESADLIEMSRSSVCVVCAGAKTVLDIPKTLERLETLGVSVITLGQEDFPAFYTRSSGVRSPHSVHSVQEIAGMLNASDQLCLQSGTLVAVPVPVEYEAESSKVQNAILRALSDAEKQHIVGAAITPFLLSKVVQYTDGNALQTNQRLAENNAATAAQIAVAFSTGRDGQVSVERERAPASGKEIVVIGATIMDIYSQANESTMGLISGTSNPGTVAHSTQVRRSFGGVGRNIAVALNSLRAASTAFVTAVGSDEVGQEAVANLARLGVHTDTVLRREGFSTATYVAVHSADGDMAVAIADTSLYDASPLLPLLTLPSTFVSAKHVVMDANIQLDEMRVVVNECRKRRCHLYYETTSVPKCTKIIKAGGLSAVTWTFPNEAEAIEMGMAAAGRRVRSPEDGARVLLELGVKRVVVTRGERGASLFRHGPKKDIEMIGVEAVKVQDVKNTAGAGDVLAAAVVHALSRGSSDIDALRAAVLVAARSVSSHDSVPPNLVAKL